MSLASFSAASAAMRWASWVVSVRRDPHSDAISLARSRDVPIPGSRGVQPLALDRGRHARRHECRHVLAAATRSRISDDDASTGPSRAPRRRPHAGRRGAGRRRSRPARARGRAACQRSSAASWSAPTIRHEVAVAGRGQRRPACRRCSSGPRGRARSGCTSSRARRANAARPARSAHLGGRLGGASRCGRHAGAARPAAGRARAADAAARTTARWPRCGGSNWPPKTPIRVTAGCAPARGRNVKRCVADQDLVAGRAPAAAQRRLDAAAARARRPARPRRARSSGSRPSASRSSSRPATRSVPSSRRMPVPRRAGGAGR